MPGVSTNIIFFIKALVFCVLAGIIIPKEYYKKYLIYGLFLGAGIDIIVVFTLTHLGFVKYLNMGAFSIFGVIAFWTPIAWMSTVMIFLYFLPRRKLFLVSYILMFALYGIFLGEMLSNFGLYTYNRLIMFFVFLGWFSLAAWTYLRLERIQVK